MTVNCLPSPVPVICITAPPIPNLDPSSDLSIPYNSVCKVPAQPTFPPNGETPNDNDDDPSSLGDATANACLVDEIAASTDSVRIPATTTAAITDIVLYHMCENYYIFLISDTKDSSSQRVYTVRRIGMAEMNVTKDSSSQRVYTVRRIGMAEMNV